jgi:predicted dinucleotide-binding enzyme
MTYSIIGSGNIGPELARQFASNSVRVAITNARGPGLPTMPHIHRHCLEAP